MAKKAAAAQPVTSAPKEISKFQAETRVIHRSQIIEATYNPREISPDAFTKLKRSIRENKNVGVLTWNERNGVLVGGHQRLRAMDELEGHLDYHITVAVVNLNDKDERALNISLNNVNSQGDWNLEALQDVLVDIGKLGGTLADTQFTAADLEDFGFLRLDEIASLFPEDPAAQAITDSFDLETQPQGHQAAVRQLNQIAENRRPQTAEEIAKIKATRAKFRQDAQVDVMGKHEITAVVIFRNATDRVIFMESLGLSSYEKYCEGDRIFSALAGRDLFAEADARIAEEGEAADTDYASDGDEEGDLEIDE